MNGSGLVAQWIEHPPSKRVVAGSNPARSVFLFLERIISLLYVRFERVYTLTTPIIFVEVDCDER